MKLIGLTGGIGSGKTTVAKVFENLGSPVYYADEAAHKIRSKPEVEQQIVDHFGFAVCTHNLLDKKKLAEIVFSNPEALEWLNRLLHPLLAEDFKEWAADKSQKGHTFVIMEAAILFEAGFEKIFDEIISVYAPQELVIERLRKRSNYAGDADIINRINAQMSPEIKVQRANHVIYNDEHQSVLEQVLRLTENF